MRHAAMWFLRASHFHADSHPHGVPVPHLGEVLGYWHKILRSPQAEADGRRQARECAALDRLREDLTTVTGTEP
jgi:hypothetical protein